MGGSLLSGSMRAHRLRLSKLLLLSGHGGRGHTCCWLAPVAFDPERPCGLRAAYRVLPPAPLHLIIVLAAAPTRIASLRVRIALEKEAEAVVAPVVAARNGTIDRRPARHEAALGLVVQHRDELGAIIGLAAQRLVRDDDRRSRQCSWRDAAEHGLRHGYSVERVPGILPVFDGDHAPARAPAVACHRA